MKNLLLLFSIMTYLTIASGTMAQARYAIVVGHDLGHPGEDPLRFAQNDAKRFHQVLVELGDVKAFNAHLLIAPKARQIFQTIDKLEQKMLTAGSDNRGSVVIFYYAGHGDEKSLHLGREDLPKQKIIERLKTLSSDLKIAVLDACQTRRVSNTRGVKPAKGFEVGVVEPATPQGVVVIHSTQSGNPAHESDALKGALFTHFWISAMRGAADFDRDGRISLLEAYTYTYRQTVRDSAGSSSVVQRPTYNFELEGTNELILSSPSKSNSTLILPPMQGANYLVYHQHSGAVIAEAISSDDQQISLAVPAGRFVVHRRTSRNFAVADVELYYGGTQTLLDQHFKSYSYDQLISRGGRMDLAPNALTAGYVLRADLYGDASSDWSLSNGIGLGYQRVFYNNMLLRISASGAWATYVLKNNQTKEQTYSLAALVGWQKPFRRSRIHFAGGPLVQFIFQERERTDAENLDGIEVQGEVSSHHRGVGPGGTLHIGISVPIVSRLEAQLRFIGSVLALKTKREKEVAW